MAYTTPRTWTSATLTAAQLNTDVKDNIDWLASSKHTWQLVALSHGIGTAAYTAIPYSSESWDNGGLHSTSSNHSRVTISVAGKYMVFGWADFAANATGTSRYQAIRKNGATLRYVNSPKDSNNAAYSTIAMLVSCAAGDYLEHVAYQDSGSTLTCNFNFDGTWYST